MPKDKKSTIENRKKNLIKLAMAIKKSKRTSICIAQLQCGICVNKHTLIVLNETREPRKWLMLCGTIYSIYNKLSDGCDLL